MIETCRKQNFYPVFFKSISAGFIVFEMYYTFFLNNYVTTAIGHNRVLKKLRCYIRWFILVITTATTTRTTCLKIILLKNILMILNQDR